MADLVYAIGNKLYVNLTNRCPNDCTFCVRQGGPGVAGASLWLDSEPPAEDYVKAIGDPDRYAEIVFCGYGEPLMRAGTLAEVARAVRRLSRVPMRVDTNGQARLFLGRDVLPDLVGLIDGFSISLNAQDEATYRKLSRPAYGERAYQALLDFAREAVGLFPAVTLSVVSVPGVDVDACRRIAERLGAGFRVRDYIDSGNRYLEGRAPDEAGLPGGGEKA